MLARNERSPITERNYSLQQQGTLSLIVYSFSPGGAKNYTQGIEIISKRKFYFLLLLSRYLPKGQVT
jgi:hypothetical protein